jgi:hypothetical protein
VTRPAIVPTARAGDETAIRTVLMSAFKRDVEADSTRTWKSDHRGFTLQIVARAIRITCPGDPR